MDAFFTVIVFFSSSESGKYLDYRTKNFILSNYPIFLKSWGLLFLTKHQ